MAKQVITTLVDDLDGSEVAESIHFSFRGASCTIDLNEKNGAAFDRAMSKYLAAAVRESARRPTTKPAAVTAPPRRDLAEVRSWATEQGWEVSTRGRVAAEILDPYDAAH